MLAPMRRASVLSLILLPAVAAADDPDLVTRMAKVGRCAAPALSPDGKTLACICDLSGTPQVWSVPTAGGWPTQLTALDDPVGDVAWSHDGSWLAYAVAPGGGLNVQIYVMRPDGGGAHVVTEGGKTNNFLG